MNSNISEPEISRLKHCVNVRNAVIERMEKELTAANARCEALRRELAIIASCYDDKPECAQVAREALDADTAGGWQ